MTRLFNAADYDYDAMPPEILAAMIEKAGCGVLVALSMEYHYAETPAARAAAVNSVNMFYAVIEGFIRLLPPEYRPLVSVQGIVDEAEQSIQNMETTEDRMREAFDRAMFIAHGGNA